jgi:hypothetical protein
MTLRDGTQNRPFARPAGRDQAITAAVQIGGYLRGCAKTQVALRDGHPVSRRRLAELTAPTHPLAWSRSVPCPRRSTLSAACECALLQCHLAGDSV